jgi:tRNA(Ile)-lysidine synthase
VICLPYGVRAERVYEGIRLYREAPAADMERESIEITGEMLSRAEKEEVVLALPDGRLHLRIRDFSGNMQEIPKKTYTKWFDYGKIKSGLRLRRRESGDYLKIDAAGHTKKLKEYFVNEKIPAAKRDAIWLLATGSEILWVAGGRIGAGCKVGENTEKILEVRLSGGNDCEDQEN